MKGRKQSRRRVGPLLITGLLLASVFIVCGTVAALQFTEPYAVNQDGEKVSRAWAVMVGEEEICLVESKAEGQAVIERIKAHYAEDMEHLQDVSFSPEISVVEKELRRGEETPKLKAPEWAAAEVVVQNETGAPVVTVTTTETVEKTKKIEHETKYKESDELYEGETKTTVKGRDGVAVVTSEIIRQNGEIVQKEVIDTRITKEAVPRIIHKGTKKRLEAPTVSNIETSASDVASPASQSDEPSDSVDQSNENATQTGGEDDDTTPEDTDQADQTEPSDSDSNEQKEDNNNSGNSKQESNSSSKNSGDSDSEKNNSNSSADKSNDTGKQIAEYACKFIGNPYVYGGTSLTKGADCSGFVMSVYKHFGISLPRTSGQQALVGRSIAYSNAKPGDIVCYPGHVGIYIGNGRIVHASTPASGIKTSPATYRSIKTIRRVWD